VRVCDGVDCQTLCGAHIFPNMTDCAVSTLLKFEFHVVKLEINEGKTPAD
jgi:hypothetical protein